MNIRFLLILLISTLLLSCDNDDYPYSKVPSVVLNKFRAEYPDASDSNFNLTGDNYEVEFEIEGNDHEILMNSSGNIMKEKKEISPNVLPVDVHENLQKEFGNEKIEDLELVRTGEEIYYQFEINGFLTDEKVVLDETGKQDPTLKYWK